MSDIQSSPLNLDTVPSGPIISDIRFIKIIVIKNNIGVDTDINRSTETLRKNPRYIWT